MGATKKKAHVDDRHWPRSPPSPLVLKTFLSHHQLRLGLAFAGTVGEFRQPITRPTVGESIHAFVAARNFATGVRPSPQRFAVR